jgi:hypothetical protein
MQSKKKKKKKKKKKNYNTYRQVSKHKSWHVPTKSPKMFPHFASTKLQTRICWCSSPVVVPASNDEFFHVAVIKNKDSKKTEVGSLRNPRVHNSSRGSSFPSAQFLNPMD